MKKEYYNREDGKILFYKKNKKSLLGNPTEQDVQTFIGTVIRKALEAEGPRYLKTQGYKTWATLATGDGKATGAYVERQIRKNAMDPDAPTLVRVKGDSMWADIRSLKLHRRYDRPSRRKKLDKIPSGHQQIVTGVIKNIGDAPIRNILVKLELISKKTGRRSDIAVGMAKQRSDFQNFLRKRKESKQKNKFLPPSQEPTPLQPNETVLFEARTNNFVEFNWYDDKDIDMAIPMHESVSYEKYVNGRWVKVGRYKHKSRGYFHTAVNKKVKEYYLHEKEVAKLKRIGFNMFKVRVKKLVKEKLDRIHSENEYGNANVVTLINESKSIALKNIRQSMVRCKNEKLQISFTGDAT